MINRLPISMRTVFQDLLLLTFAVPPAALAAQLPAPIFPYVRDGQSFISIVVGNMRGMRLAGVPAFLGTNYYQIVYRAVVELHDQDGQRHPGVFFLRSDSNDPVMSFFGNRLTEFRFHYFHTGAIALFTRAAERLVSVATADGGGDLVALLQDRGPAEEGAPCPGFASVADEQATLVQLFHAYAYDEIKGVVYDLEIERGDWRMRRLEMRDYFAAFFQERPFVASETHPVACVAIQECQYLWKPMRAIPMAQLRHR